MCIPFFFSFFFLCGESCKCVLSWLNIGWKHKFLVLWKFECVSCLVRNQNKNDFGLVEAVDLAF